MIGELLENDPYDAVTEWVSAIFDLDWDEEDKLCLVGEFMSSIGVDPAAWEEFLEAKARDLADAFPD